MSNPDEPVVGGDDDRSDLDEGLERSATTDLGPRDDRSDTTDLVDRSATSASVRLRAAASIDRGTVLADRYQIEEKLGEGGSGTVFRAYDRMLGELIAIKVLHPERAREKSWIRRLTREVKLARAIRHPNVCRVFDMGNANGRWFVTLELATDGSLRDSLRASSNEPPSAPHAEDEEERESAKPMAAHAPHLSRTLSERIGDMRALSAGLAAMHAIGITHRDVTPQNVLRMADGRLVLTDFGLAIEHNDKTTVIGGTPAYMPPEVARGQQSDQRSDVFQLGMILHEILFGARPAWARDGSHLVVLEPSGESTVEEELWRLIVECVDAVPTKRPPNAISVAGRLAAAEAARPASVLTMLFKRTGRWARRHTRLLQFAGAGLALAALLRTVQVASRPPLCKGGAEQLKGIWDPSRAATIETAFSGVGKSYAHEAFSSVKTSLDAYARAWDQMYTDTCEATNVRGEQSADVLDLRMACLKQERGDLKAMTDLFAAADGDVVSRSVSAATSLPAIAHCSDIPVLRAVVRPPQDPAIRDRVEALRQRVAEARALHEAGRYEASMAEIAPVVKEARAIGYDPLIVEALHILGRAQLYTGAFAECEGSLDEAMIRAQASRHDRVLAEAAVDKTGLFTAQNRFDELNRFVPWARAALTRIGGDLRLEGWIDTDLGYSMNEKGDSAEALRLNTKALDEKMRALGPTHWDVALSLGNVANDLHGLGRDEEALGMIERAITTMSAALGSQHPQVAIFILDRGEIRLALGQPADARADFERTLAIWKSEGTLPESMSYALTGLGQSLLAENRPAEAISSLEEALQIRESVKAPPQLRAKTEFALATALWQTGRDRDRALKLAREARGLFPDDKEAERKKVDEALASWDGAASSSASSSTSHRGN
jgi:serine/threonine protein kinase/tetratricopeptide (TPR) repeat protein